MNLDTVISKLETIASRVFDPIHIGGFESIFEGEPLYLLYPVKEIWVFGSAVYVDDPRDLDICVVSGANSKILHRKFCNERRKGKTEYWRWYGYDKLVKKTLLKKMRNVDIHTDTPITVTDLKILVWSPEKPNVKENFLTGRENVDLSPECRNLRKQLKKATAGEYVLQRMCEMYLEEDTISEIKTLQNLDSYFRKEELHRLILFYEENKKKIGRFNGLDLIKKFIEIKKQKFSKRIFQQLSWKKHERERFKRVREFQRT